MPIPLFTSGEKPSNTETLPAHQKETVTSTPLTSGSEHRQEPAATSGTGTAGSASASGREQTREEREEADRLYEERMEDEYAKREGGA